MTARLEQIELLARDELVQAPVLASRTSEGCTDRTFEIPTGLYVAMAGLFFAYLAVMTIGFAADDLVVPMAVNFVFVGMFFGVPALWALMGPKNNSAALSFDRFRRTGVETLSGRCTAGATATQMLLLPLLILFWAVATTTIYALV